MPDDEMIQAIATLASRCQGLEVQSHATERMLVDSIIIPGNKVTPILITILLAFGMIVVVVGMLVGGFMYMFV